jgi:hypothetical protein
MAEALNISDIRLFNLLKGKFGEKDAEEFVSLIKNEVETSLENKKNNLATKSDIAEIQVKIAQLETTIAKTGSKLLLWAFVFLATQLAAIFTFLKFLLKKFLLK